MRQALTYSVIIVVLKKLRGDNHKKKQGDIMKVSKRLIADLASQKDDLVYHVGSVKKPRKVSLELAYSYAVEKLVPFLREENRELYDSQAVDTVKDLLTGAYRAKKFYLRALKQKDDSNIARLEKKLLPARNLKGYSALLKRVEKLHEKLWNQELDVEREDFMSDFSASFFASLNKD